MTTPFTISARIRSFSFAFAGIWTMLKSQHNAWLHATATLAVIVAGLAFQVKAMEWCLLVLAMMAV